MKIRKLKTLTIENLVTKLFTPNIIQLILKKQILIHWKMGKINIMILNFLIIKIRK